MDEQHEELRKALVSIPGITLLRNNQAEHCGYNHFDFKASENAIKKLLKSFSEIKWLNCYTSVHYEGDGLVYRLSMPPSHFEERLKQIKKS